MSNEEHPATTIQRLRVTGGFWDGLDVHLGPGLNCIVGGRGTGKTTLVELCRFAVGEAPSSAPRRAAFERLIKQNLGRGTVTVWLGSQEGVLRVSRGLGGPSEIVDEGGTLLTSIRAREETAIEIYGQQEVEHVAADPQRQLELIDGFESQSHQALAEEIRGKQARVAESNLELARLDAERELLVEHLAELPEVQRRRRAITGDGSLVAERLNRALACKGARERERRMLEKAEGRLTAIDESIDQLDHAIATLSRPDTRGEPGENEDLMGELGSVLEAVQGAARAALENTRTKVAKGSERLAALRTDVLERHVEQERAYQALLADHEHEKARAHEVARLELRETELVDLQTRMRELQATIERAQTERSALIDDLCELRQKVFDLRANTARSISERLDPTVRVEISQAGDPSTYALALANALRGTNRRYGQLVQQITRELPPAELVRLARRMAIGELASVLGLRDEQAAWVLARLSEPATLLELETVPLDDAPKIQLRDGGRYKPAAELSTGQKCTTILPIILVDGSRPLLIDQPEDNLDNRFVYETIVSTIARVKPHRQLVFVTHNANIPVLGDAERVFVTESDGERGRVRAIGSVDEVRGELEDILEGGAEAFLERKRRYGH